MAKKSALEFLSVTSIVLLVGLVLVAHAEPSTPMLDADLAEVRAQVKAAEAENAHLQGGFVKAVLALRLEVLRTTEAMLAQKRTSILRRIDLHYNIDGAPVAVAAEDKIQKITADLEKAKAELSKSEVDATRLQGGLLEALAVMTVETNRLNVAQLNLAYYGARHGLFLPLAAAGNPPEQIQHGTVVQDKNAL